MSTFDVERLGSLGTMISDTIDFEQCAFHNHIVIKYTVDTELDELKRAYEGIESMLSNVAAEMVARSSFDPRVRINVIYFPQIGYLTTIDAKSEEHVMKYAPNIISECWEFQFRTENVFYYKNQHMVELDDEIGDLYINIVGLLRIYPFLSHTASNVLTTRY
jgi:DNA mismatch repair protein MSH5